MNNAWLTSILSLGGAGGLLSLGFTLYTSIRDKDYRRAKEEGDIKLTAAQYNEIAARAAQTKTAEQIQAGEYWMNQFAAITVWDDALTKRVQELTGERVPAAPSLDPDEDDPFDRSTPGFDRRAPEGK